jgi:hypothetical protein
MKLLTGKKLIERKIFFIRSQRAILDFHLANLYGVSTKRLKEQVRRNYKRFPSDFMIELTTEEYEDLRSQFATSNIGRGGRRYLPYAFTEQGIAMLSSVLKSENAINVNIEIMRAFVKLRNILTSDKEIARKIFEMEQKYDAQFKVVFDTIRQLMQPPEIPKRQIGFRVGEPKVVYKIKKKKSKK